MYKKILCGTVCAFLILVGSSAALNTRAEGSGIIGEIQSNLGTPGSGEGFQKGLEAPGGDLMGTVGKIIRGALSLLFVILVVLIIYAGFLWMTAGGETKQVDKAKDYIKNAVMGLIIIVLAYVITDFIITKISEATNEGGQGVPLP